METIKTNWQAIHLESIPQFLMKIKEYSLAMEVMGSHMDKELKRMQGLHITLMEIVILIQINNYLTMMEQVHTKVL